MSFEFVLLVHLACCLILTGLIWTVQLVHYPAFLWISESGFKEFHSFHSRKITFIVGPLMLVELFSALVLAFQRPEILWLSNLALVVPIWLCTAFVSIPIHNRLTLGLDRPEILKLIKTNWPRTLLWTVRSLLVALSLHSLS